MENDFTLLQYSVKSVIVQFYCPKIVQWLSNDVLSPTSDYATSLGLLSDNNSRYIVVHSFIVIEDLKEKKWLLNRSWSVSIGMFGFSTLPATEPSDPFIWLILMNNGANWSDRKADRGKSYSTILEQSGRSEKSLKTQPFPGSGINRCQQSWVGMASQKTHPKPNPALVAGSGSWKKLSGGVKVATALKHGVKVRG